MARQSKKPVNFNMTSRPDSGSIRTSGRAGQVVPFMYAPVMRGDSASGTVNAHLQLNHMPRPLVNGVMANAQVWFVPKLAHAQFNGEEEFLMSYQEESITALGQPDRAAPPFFHEVVDPADLTAVASSPMFQTLGIHLPAGKKINTDLIDAFQLVYNFRLAAHSSNLALRPYALEDLSGSTTLNRAFWPTGRFSRIVADYERALVVGSLQLDVAAGQLPISGLTRNGTAAASSNSWIAPLADKVNLSDEAGVNGLSFQIDENGVSSIFAEMAGQAVVTSLADIDKARATQAFAKLRTSMNGAQTTGFKSDDALLAELMQGFAVPASAWAQPILLDSKIVPVGFDERKATDGASLEMSSTQGRTDISLSVNLPANPHGGYIVATVEVLPERLNEAMSDEMLLITSPSELPDALRDSLRVEPTDVVPNRRIDARHSAPDTAYGWERMNDVHSREDTTRFGGDYYQADPAAPWTEARSAIWLAEIIDPVYSTDHFLAPDPFPHSVFSDTTKPAFELIGRHSLSFAGITQIGDPLVENDDSYDAVAQDPDMGEKPPT